MIYENPILSGSIGVSGSLTVNGTDLTNGAISASFATATNSSSISIKAVNQNTNSGSISFWHGSKTEYDAISGSADPTTLYFTVE